MHRSMHGVVRGEGMHRSMHAVVRGDGMHRSMHGVVRGDGMHHNERACTPRTIIPMAPYWAGAVVLVISDCPSSGGRPTLCAESSVLGVMCWELCAGSYAPGVMCWELCAESYVLRCTC